MILTTMRLTVALLLFLTSVSVVAQSSVGSYPTRPIKFFLPHAPGGGTDLIGRMIAQRLRADFGQPVVAENRPGVATLLAAESVAKSPADGYTLMLATNSTFAISPLLFANPKIDPMKDLTPISRVGATIFYLITSPSLPVKTVKELINIVRKNPGKFNYASAGSGSAHHLFMEALKMEAGLDILHVPYKGGAAALTGLLSGKIEMMFLDGTLAVPNIRSGKVTGLGTSMVPKRPLIGSVPAIADTVPGYNYGGWMAVAGPGGMPIQVVARISEVLERFYKSEEFQNVMAKTGIQPMEPISPSAMREFVSKELAYWGSVIKASGAKVD